MTYWNMQEGNIFFIINLIHCITWLPVILSYKEIAWKKIFLISVCDFTLHLLHPNDDV